jgi:hypothetical protein
MADNRIQFTFELNDQGKVKVDGVTKSFVKLETAMKKVTAEYKRQQAESAKTNDGLNTTITNAGLAGATITEFGRTISDLPYGIRGVANNLSQLSTLFITFVSKVDKSVIGMARVTTAFKMLGAQLKGPLGFILLFQSIIALLDYFSGSSKKAKENTDELTKAFSRQRKELNALAQTALSNVTDDYGAIAEEAKFLAENSSEFAVGLEKLNKGALEGVPGVVYLIDQFNELLKVRDEISNLTKEEEIDNEALRAALIKRIELERIFTEEKKKQKKKPDRELVEGSIEFYEEQIKVLKKSQALATDPAAFAILEDRVKGIQKLIDDIKGIREDVESASALSAQGLKIDPKDFEKEKTPAQLLAEDQLKAFKKVEIGAKKHTLSMEEINFRLAMIDADRLDHFASATDALAGLFGERTAAGKAFAIATAVIDTYAGANLALKDPTIPNTFVRIAAVTSVIATGLANVKSILSVDESGQTTPSGAGGQGAAQTQAPVFNVVGQSKVDQLGRAISEARSEPLKAYVIGSEVSNQQDLDNKIIQSATLG